MIFNVLQPQVNNELDGWNGYSKGQLVTSGVYIYMINYSRNGQSQVKFGTVTLVN